MCLFRHCSYFTLATKHTERRYYVSSVNFFAELGKTRGRAFGPAVVAIDERAYERNDVIDICIGVRTVGSDINMANDKRDRCVHN
jgi:hypothetical protein